MAEIRDYTDLMDYGKLDELLAQESSLMDEQGKRIAYHLAHSKGKAEQVVSDPVAFEDVVIKDEDGDTFEAVGYVEGQF